MTNSSGLFLSLVIPLWEESDLVGPVLKEITKVAESLNENYEVIIVDDGSRDPTFERILSFRAADARVKGIRLSRNFGKEAAMLAGMTRASGRVVVTMDGDLQHPPDIIPEMIEKWRGGAQIVHGVKKTRSYGGFVRRITARSFNHLFSRLVDFSVVDSSDFKLLDAKIARLLVERFPENERFHRGLTAWVGFQQESVTFEVPARTLGESRWSRRALLRYGWNTLTSYTSLPLQAVPALGAVMLLVSLLLGTEAIVSRIRGQAISGFATVEITILFSASVIMIGLGIIGQYLARVYDELKRRPIYVVAEEVGFEGRCGNSTKSEGIIPS